TPPPPIPFATRPDSGGKWTTATSKRKREDPDSRDNALVTLARAFPASTTVSLQRAQVAVSGRPTSPTPSQVRKAKRRKHTTHGASRKQVTVYSSPSITWEPEKVLGQ